MVESVDPLVLTESAVLVGLKRFGDVVGVVFLAADSVLRVLAAVGAVSLEMTEDWRAEVFAGGLAADSVAVLLSGDFFASVATRGTRAVFVVVVAVVEAFLASVAGRFAEAAVFVLAAAVVVVVGFLTVALLVAVLDTSVLLFAAAAAEGVFAVGEREDAFGLASALVLPLASAVFRTGLDGAAAPFSLVGLLADDDCFSVFAVPSPSIVLAADSLAPSASPSLTVS